MKAIPSRKMRAMLAVILMASLQSCFYPRPARATDRDVKAVIIAGSYGLAGGTLLGLAAYPLTSKPRSIAIGSSIGLYLGIAIGFYHITHRDDPDNPFRAETGRDLTPERIPPVYGTAPALIQAELEVAHF